MMTLRERQDQFINDLSLFDDWVSRFNYMIELSDTLSAECPEELRAHRIQYCKSATYFKAEKRGDKLHVRGWSNTPVMRGMIVCICNILDGISVDEISGKSIDFHVKSGLLNNLTSQRQLSLLEIINRVLSVSL